MKKRSCFIISLALMVSIAAYGSGKNEALSSSGSAAYSRDLVVFAAASMTETLEEIAVLYKGAAPNINLVFNFDSSGTLKTQIEQGADCDLFISAGQLQADQLDIAADPSVNTNRLDLLLQGTRINLLENQITLCVPSGNPAGVMNFDDLADKLRKTDILFAMGNSDVPVGQYTQRIFAYYSLDEKALAAAGRITYGSNVKEVTTQISEASVSCGVVYCTDAFSAGLTVVDYATVEMCGQVVYPAAVLKASRNADAAKAFLSYLQTPEAMTVFERVGFAAAR